MTIDDFSSAFDDPRQAQGGPSADDKCSAQHALSRCLASRRLPRDRPWGSEGS